MNKRRYENSFREIVRAYIKKFPQNIVLRNDLNKLGSSRQITRALKNLIEDGCIVKLGYGIYAKAEISEYTGKPIITVGFTNACIEAINRLGLEWKFATSVRNYNEGESTQVPVKFIIKLKSRYRGTIGYQGRNVIFEKQKNVK